MSDVRDMSDLARAVAAEVRSELAIRHSSGLALSRHIGRSQTYVSVRLRAKKPFDLSDLEAICRVFDVPPVEFVHRALRRGR